MPSTPPVEAGPLGNKEKKKWDVRSKRGQREPLSVDQGNGHRPRWGPGIQTVPAINICPFSPVLV